MDWQTIAAYLVVAAALILAARWVIRAVRGKPTMPACPGCKKADKCEILKQWKTEK